ncbi:glutathione transferase [Botrytis cinerea]
MDQVNSGLHQQIPTTYRQLQPQAEQALQHGQPHLHHHTLTSQAGLDLSGLVQDDNNSVYHPDLRSLQDPNAGHPIAHQYPSPIPFERNNGHPQMHVQNPGIQNTGLQNSIQNNGSPHTPQQQHPGPGQFGILTAGPSLHHNPIGRLQQGLPQDLQQDDNLFGTPDETDQKSIGHHSHKIVPNPPDLAAWREKLFNVNEMITLSEEEYNTYFPHVDNVYSHRSTQKYKRKPFVSHYWDCRLKACQWKRGNGKGDGVAGPHKHDLARSDEIKKNSILRFLQKREKEDKKTQKMTDTTCEQKTYHKRASGLALSTVKKHTKENDLKLFGSCFCPFVQRVWIALEAKGIQYQYIEVDPYKKPQSLLEVNPRGLVPAIRHGDWGCGESTVLMEYIEDLQTGPPLFPQDARAKAHSRLWADHIDRKIVPTFYALLQSQNYEKQEELTAKLRDEISQIVDVCDPQGPFFLGPTLTYTDVHFAPWILRCRRVLKHYRDWQDPQPGSRWAIWFDAIENNEFVKATTSADELYIDSYERYAMNRPGTSELADAVNGGFNLP